MGSTNPNTVIGYNKSRILSTPGNIMRFPSEDIPYKMLLSFHEYSFMTSAGLINPSAEKASMAKNPAGSIVLPLPLQLTDSTNIDATSTSSTEAVMLRRGMDLLTPGNIASPGFEDLALYSDLISKATATLGALVGKSNKLAGGALIGVSAALQAATSSPIQQVNGFALNPFETMQFKGVQLKRHSFAWKLSPSNAGESDTLRNIINRIKANILPEYVDPSAGSAHSLLKYPAVATISFYGIDQSYYYALKPSMITGLSVNYNGSEQLNVYRGGKPVVIDLKMDLTEMVIHTSEDYGGGTYTELSSPVLPNMNENGVVDTGGVIPTIQNPIGS